MYRYLLFNCPGYYPAGGMRDCEFKSNDLNELESFVNKYCDDNWWGHIHYYDIVENRIMYAKMESYVREDGFSRQRFVCWEER